MNMLDAKGPEAFRTISEASAELGVPSHILRFWETKFTFIQPMKRAGGRRLYRPRDLDVLKGVRVLLHEEGYTIKGVQRLHKEQGVRRLMIAGGCDGIEDPYEQDADLEPLVRVQTDEEGAPGAGMRGKPVLDDAARAKLRTALDDLESAKAAIDALLDPVRPIDSP